MKWDAKVATDRSLAVMPGTRVRPPAGPSVNLVPGIHALLLGTN
jgi:hypothetical protein